MSAAITSLTPNQVNDELNKMQAFIKKEAEEKAKEIKLKADQEYEIEKSSILRTEISNIDSNFEDKLKKLKLKQQINKSTVKNKNRLKILSAKDEILNEISEVTKQKLIALSKNQGEYKKVLLSLIVEAALRLLDTDIVIRVKESDSKLVLGLIDNIKKEYKEISKRDVEVSVSESFLPKDSIGGAIVSDAAGKIEVNNTLEERLNLLNEEALPAIRFEIYGPSSTRKFFD
ncbi:hypothetical protein TPHA_0N00500 [Tetrapisispora phaffii CBS 4417]|uniref:V-type proton ATPase subunit E n=1 Tax=Tetrapisispora phaffii (strain ATCC 24235 / CBS 4417 / NBRC 1672 / NRRL Y-8282 / UCD 70-5) TaxID=1071381 RepID=G8C102_TETPH|nr:hypothetical protein TPHA_0N00500 [Tetrapisispora phaffii CBS 4417]CCE65830.1 hypothetical protein TPHA_0N00500 [Tetrapisispora phaffii CBS 4417]